MRCGAIHRPAPPSVQPLAARVALDAMAVPPRADWFAKVPADGDALGNLQAGNCVEVNDYRVVQIRRANTGKGFWPLTAAMTLSRYTRLTGYDPATGLPDNGTPTDQDMADWCRNGIQVNEQDLDVPHWVKVDPGNNDHVSLAIVLAGPVSVTLNLPLAMQDPAVWNRPPGNGAGWVPGSWGEHRVPVGAYDGKVKVCRTWGTDRAIHPEIWSAIVLAVDVTLSREWFDDTGLAPNGLDWDTLTADMATLRIVV